MEIRHWTVLIYADYCYFFSSAKIGKFIYWKGIYLLSKKREVLRVIKNVSTSKFLSSTIENIVY